MKKYLKNKIIIISSFLPLILSFSVNAEEKVSQENFKYYSDIEGNILKNQINYVYLKDNFLSNSENDLKDIRVFSSSNTEIPFILIDEQIPEDKKEIKYFEIIDYFQQNDKDIIIGKVKDKSLPSFEKIIFESLNTDFNKKIKVFASNDKNKWDFITESNIYDFVSKINLRKTEIKFITPTKYIFYKFEFQNLSQSEKESMLKLNYKGLDLSLNDYDSNPFRINNISGETYYKNKEIINYDEKEYIPEVENKDKKSIIRLKNKLSVNKINFNISEPYYYREINIFSGDKDNNPILKDYIYDLGNNENDEKKYINLNFHISKDLRTEILNYDNPPLIINKLKTQRVKKNLFFLSNNDSMYKIFTSNKDIESGVYDIRNYINEYNWYKTKYNKLNISQVLENKDFKEGFSKDEQEKLQKNILMALVFFIAGILGYWIYKMMKDISVKPEN